MGKATNSASWLKSKIFNLFGIVTGFGFTKPATGKKQHVTINKLTHTYQGNVDRSHRSYFYVQGDKAISVLNIHKQKTKIFGKAIGTQRSALNYAYKDAQGRGRALMARRSFGNRFANIGLKTTYLSRDNFDKLKGFSIKTATLRVQVGRVAGHIGFGGGRLHLGAQVGRKALSGSIKGKYLVGAVAAVAAYKVGKSLLSRSEKNKRISIGLKKSTKIRNRRRR